MKPIIGERHGRKCAAGIQQKDKRPHKHASNRERREGKGEMEGIEIGREGSEEGKGRWTGKF